MMHGQENIKLLLQVFVIKHVRVKFKYNRTVYIAGIVFFYYFLILCDLIIKRMDFFLILL